MATRTTREDVRTIIRRGKSGPRTKVLFNFGFFTRKWWMEGGEEEKKEKGERRGMGRKGEEKKEGGREGG